MLRHGLDRPPFSCRDNSLLSKRSLQIEESLSTGWRRTGNATKFKGSRNLWGGQEVFTEKVKLKIVEDGSYGAMAWEVRTKQERVNCVQRTMKRLGGGADSWFLSKGKEVPCGRERWGSFYGRPRRPGGGVTARWSHAPKLLRSINTDALHKTGRGTGGGEFEGEPEFVQHVWSFVILTLTATLWDQCSILKKSRPRGDVSSKTESGGQCSRVKTQSMLSSCYLWEQQAKKTLSTVRV